ncbi:MAG: ribulose-phosphate 3-epimerase [Candidatus Omnitrophica bacterium]|nr:ribulose-phosphate 3-epimerase [Candidatus Omnitrophota bacterium]
MTKSIQVGASILCADFTNLRDEIRKCEDAGIDMIHVDVMDGHFVPVITVGQLIVEAIRPLTKLPIEAHLMVEHPFMQIDHFINAGADIISIHAECYGQLRLESQGVDKFPKEVDAIDTEMARQDILRIKERGKKAFMVLNPGTPLCIHSVLDDLDGVMIMSVNPGFAKQKFMPVALPKIQELRHQFLGDIAVDGGINKDTAPEAVKAGANIFATASYFFGASNPREAVKYLRSLG